MALFWNWLGVITISWAIFGNPAAFAQSPQVSFEKQTIQIGHKKIVVEIAKSSLQQQHGLMFRQSLGKNEGMLFIFDEEKPLSFWMKNTYIDLSIAYINKDKKIIQILDMAATSALAVQHPSYPSSGPAQYALEMNQGWFKKNKISVGDRLVLNP